MAVVEYKDLNVWMVWNFGESLPVQEFIEGPKLWLKQNSKEVLLEHVIAEHSLS